ncbi:hypothetical protein DRJ54_06665 [Candidatus Acetothermia bacterium]|nr:MAG: hypothetical protein DRJ54_06665 [Candidatus Acetothermia bacterium]
MIQAVVVAAFSLALGMGASGVELWGWCDSKLSLVVDTSKFSWENTVHLDLDLTPQLSSSLQVRLEDTQLDRVIAQASWYERPLRLQGSCEFKGMAFHRAKAELRYRQAPWLLKLVGELPSEDPSSLVLAGDYEDEVLEANFEVLWEEVAFTELGAYLDLPAFLDWRTRWGLDLEAGQTPSLGCRAYGPVPWGRLTFYWEDLVLSRIRFQGEAGRGGWQHEIDFDWTAGDEPELDIDSLFQLDEQTGYGLDVNIVGWHSLAIKELVAFGFGPGWKLSVDPIDQELSLRAGREFNEVELGCDFVWGVDGLEGGLWLDFHLGGVELTSGLSWEGGAPKELFLQAYLEF